MVYQDVDGGRPLVGHSVYVNETKVLACMESVVLPGQRSETEAGMLPNATFRTRVVAGLIHISSASRVAIHVSSQATIRLSPHTTYFGLIKLQ